MIQVGDGVLLTMPMLLSGREIPEFLQCYFHINNLCDGVY